MSQSFPDFVVTSRLSLFMKDIAQGLSNSERTFPSNLPPALPVTTLLAQAFEAKFISNISITVRINIYPTRRISPKPYRKSFPSCIAQSLRR
jgi:hypothetical protein